MQTSGVPTVRRALWMYLGAITALWIVAGAIVGFRGAVLRKPYPYNALFFIPDVRFTDFTIFNPRFEVFGQGSLFFSLPGFPFTYPAPLLLGFAAFWQTPNPLYAYLFTVLIFAAAATVVVLRWVPRRSPVGSLACFAALASAASFPLMYLLDRANIEGLVWIAAATGVFCFARGRYTAAAVLLGLAASMKIYPGALLLLFLGKRRYRDFVIGMLAAVVFDVGSLWLAGPRFFETARAIASGMDFFRRTQILEYRRPEVGFEHSLFSCVKQTIHILFSTTERINAVLPRVYFAYAAVAALGFIGLYLLRIRKMPLLNQVFALTALSVTLPFVSYDYTLVHMFVPCALFLLFLVRDAATGAAPITERHALAFLLPCAVLFTPQSYLLIQGIGFGGQVKTAALVALTAAAVLIPLKSSIFGELNERLVLDLNLKISDPVVRAYGTSVS
jgi:hypothetical protein